MTTQRMVICNIVKQAKGHLTAAQICELAKKKLGKVALATVYNNLNTLVDEGIIGRLCADGHTDLYDKIPFSHGHFICTECGEINDLPAADIKKYLFEKTGEDIESFSLIIKYKCKKCYEGDKK